LPALESRLSGLPVDIRAVRSEQAEQLEARADSLGQLLAG
jgi:hypothetical protein